MKTVLKSVALLAVLSLAVSPAMADMTAVLGSYHSTFGNVGGGYFEVTRTGDLADWALEGVAANFRTFCVENVYFTPGVTYYATIEDVVRQGAVGDASLTSDTRDLYAAYVDSAFSGTYNGLSLNAVDTANEIGGLQAALWTLEGVPYTTNSSYTSYRNAYLAWAAANSLTSAANVRVLNLWTYANHTGDVQSQLVMVNRGGDDAVPAPGAALLGAIGLGLVGWIKRRTA